MKGATDKNAKNATYKQGLTIHAFCGKNPLTFGLKIQYSLFTHLDEFLFLFVVRCAVRRTEHRRHHRLQRLLQIFGVLTRTKTS